jgi:hypothetical protein
MVVVSKAKNKVQPIKWTKLWMTRLPSNYSLQSSSSEVLSFFFCVCFFEVFFVFGVGDFLGGRISRW